jgi:hypothetical protein
MLLIPFSRFNPKKLFKIRKRYEYIKLFISALSMKGLSIADEYVKEFGKNVIFFLYKIKEQDDGTGPAWRELVPVGEGKGGEG